MSNLKVLVVGASIAGPAVAYWLAKAGATVTVIERFPELRTNGRNIDIRSVGVTVMRLMPGMEDSVRRKVMPLDGISFVHSDGRPFGTITAAGNPDKQSLVSEYEIARGDLSQILFDMTHTNENITYVFGEKISSIRHSQEKNNGPITIEFANGYPTSDYDFVVACDGATSKTRALAFKCGVRDHMEPVNCWAAYFTTQKDLFGGSNMGHAYSAVGGRFAAAGTDATGATHVTFMGIHPRGNHDALKTFRDAQKEGDHALKAFVAAHYQGAGWRCDELVKEMIDTEDFYANEIVQIKMPTLHNGRIVLVGDAGYAPGPTGAGTSLAIAGAYVLASEIKRGQGDIAAGLRGYEERMRPLLADLQKIPPLIPIVFAPQTLWGIWLRNTAFAIICWIKGMGLTQRLTITSFGTSDKYGLSDYEWEA